MSEIRTRSLDVQGCCAPLIIATFKSLAKWETSTTLSTISWTADTLGKNWAACFVFDTVCFSASFNAFAHSSTRVFTSFLITFLCTVSPMCTNLWALSTTNFPCARNTCFQNVKNNFLLIRSIKSLFPKNKQIPSIILLTFSILVYQFLLLYYPIQPQIPLSTNPISSTKAEYQSPIPLNYSYRKSYRRIKQRAVYNSDFQVHGTRLWWLVVLDRLHEGVNRVSQVIAMRDHLGGIESQQLFVVGVHGCRCRGWHLNRGIVRLGYQQIVIAAKLLGQGCSHFLALLRHHLSRVQVHVIVILACPAIVAAAGRDDRRPFEQKRRITLPFTKFQDENK